MSSAQATVAEEEYLQIMFWLQEARLPITGANIARAMQVSAPTVHEMVGRLEKDKREVFYPSNVRMLRIVHGLRPGLADAMLRRIMHRSAAP